MMKDEKIFIDPVCNMKVKMPSEKEMQLLSVTHEGKTYYFCSTFCTAAFIRNPSKYTNKTNSEQNKNQG